MNRGDLIKGVAERLGQPKAQAEQAVAAVLTEIAAALHQGADVQLHAFGVLRVVQLAARQGRAPDGTPYHTPARPTVRFSPAASLEARLPGPADA